MTRIFVKTTKKIVILTKNHVRKEARPWLRNRLKERRAALGVNQQELGRLAGVSRQTISLIERGDYSPSVTLALTLAKICGVTVEDIFILEEDSNEKQ